MKKFTSIILAILLLTTISAALSVESGAVTYVSDGVFDYAVESEDTYMLYRYHGSDDEVVLPEYYNGKRIVGIRGYCFKDSTITSVTIPDSYTTIGELAFNGCRNISEIVVPSGIESIGNMAFANCESLETIDFSSAENLTSLPYALCLNDASLNHIILPESVSAIGESAFEGCGFTSLAVGGSVKTVGERAFANCADLSDLKLTQGLETIGAEAFYGDSSVDGVLIPSSVTSIGDDAFAPMAGGSGFELDYYTGSYAQTYCEENGIENAVGHMLGDVDGNESVDINDVTYLQIGLVGRITLTPDEKIKADVNFDDNTTIRDATLIQMFIARIITEF